MDNTWLMVGARCRYHPIIGEAHDGRTYIVSNIGQYGGYKIAWLQDKTGWVAAEALSQFQPPEPGAVFVVVNGGSCPQNLGVTVKAEKYLGDQGGRWTSECGRYGFALRPGQRMWHCRVVGSRPLTIPNGEGIMCEVWELPIPDFALDRHIIQVCPA